METRKQYTKEFKLAAISLVLDQGFTIAEAARSLEIRANMLGRWIKENQESIGLSEQTSQQPHLIHVKGYLMKLENHFKNYLSLDMPAIIHPSDRKNAYPTDSQVDNNGQAFRGNGKLTPDQEEIRRLKIENKQLKLERQILNVVVVT